jgi:perosamine synthetase
LAAGYREALSGHPYLLPPVEPADAEPNYQSYAVRLTDDAPIDRDELLKQLLARGIAAKPGVMTIHRQPAYCETRNGSGSLAGSESSICADLPITERASDRSLLLPLYPGLTRGEQRDVLDALCGAFELETATDQAG